MKINKFKKEKSVIIGIATILSFFLEASCSTPGARAGINQENNMGQQTLSQKNKGNQKSWAQKIPNPLSPFKKMFKKKEVNGVSYTYDKKTGEHNPHIVMEKE